MFGKFSHRKDAVDNSRKYDIVIIKAINENLFFVGRTFAGSKNRINLLKYYKSTKDGEFMFKKLTKYFLKNGEDSIDVKFIEYNCNIKEILKKEYEIQNKLIEKFGAECLLNDYVIDPTPVKCECGENIRKGLLEVHKEKYCSWKNGNPYGDFDISELI